MSKTVAFIPARGGSKRVPGKNIRPLQGLPLIAYTISAAISSNVFDEIYVSTDDPETAEIATQFGARVPALRPREMASSNSPDIEWVTHALLNWCPKETSTIALLRPTSPLRQARTISDALKKFRDAPWADSLRALQPVAEHPGKMWRLMENMEAKPYVNQDERKVPTHSSPTNTLEKLWVQNASLEIMRSTVIVKKETIAGDHVLGYQMPNYEGFDINTENDWDYLLFLVGNNPQLLPQYKG